MPTTLPKATVANILLNKPDGVQDVDVINGLLSRGYQLEGYGGPQPDHSIPGNVPVQPTSIAQQASDSLGTGMAAGTPTASDLQTAQLQQAKYQNTTLGNPPAPSENPFNRAKAENMTLENNNRNALQEGRISIEEAAADKAITTVDKVTKPITAGIGYLASGAWNNIIKPVVDEYNRPAMEGLTKTFGQENMDKAKQATDDVTTSIVSSFNDYYNSLDETSKERLSNFASLLNSALTVSAAGQGLKGVKAVVDAAPDIYAAGKVFVADQVAGAKTGLQTGMEAGQSARGAVAGVGNKISNAASAAKSDIIAGQEATRVAKVKELTGKITQLKDSGDLAKAERGLVQLSKESKAQSIPEGLKDTNKIIARDAQKVDKVLTTKTEIFDPERTFTAADNTRVAVKNADGTYSLKPALPGAKGATDPVSNALDQLETYYNKTLDTEGATKISDLRNKYGSEGLTPKEMNDLARLHGNTLNTFNESGEASTQISKVAIENTRKGVKDVVRVNMPDNATKILDSRISDMETLKNALTKQAEGLQGELNRTAARNVIQKAADTVGKVTGPAADLIGSATGLKATGKTILKAFGKEGQGLTNTELNSQFGKMLEDLRVNAQPRVGAPSTEPALKLNPQGAKELVTPDFNAKFEQPKVETVVPKPKAEEVPVPKAKSSMPKPKIETVKPKKLTK